MKNTFIWTIIIFICAASFRLTNLGLIEFKLDEARDVYEMNQFWQNPHLLERGTVQSTGVYNPPLWYYFLILISLPSRDPQYLSFVIGLINCIAVAGFYLVVRKFYGQTLGIVAGLLMAFSPWMIIFSRKIWAPDLIFPLVVVWFYFLHLIVIPTKVGIHTNNLYRSRIKSGMTEEGGVNYGNNRWAWLGLVLTLMLLAQLHASGIFLGLASIIVITIITVITKTRINFKFALLGFLISLIPLIPYLIYQLQNNCPDCQAYVTYQQGEALGAVPFFDPNSFLRPFQFIGGSGFQNALGEEGLGDFVEKYPLIGVINFVFLLEFIIFILGIVFLIKQKRYVLLGILGLAAILIFITRTPGYLYYFLIVSPILILIYSLGIILISQKMGRIGLISLIGLILLSNIVFTFSFYKYLSETKIVPGDYGQIYSLLKEQAQEKGMRVEEFVISLYRFTQMGN